MKISENTSPLLLKRVDELIIPQHSYLLMEDEAYFLGEYTVGALSDHSPMNRLIINYKKNLERREYSDWQYKEKAIQDVGKLFRTSILQTIGLSERLEHATLVPIPPSKAKKSQDYDDRNHRMLQGIIPGGDVRELILQKQSRDSLHASKGNPRDYKDLLNNYTFNEEALCPNPKEIWLFDDMLTKGTHFRAAKEFLKEKFPNVLVIGFFIARSISKRVIPL